MAVAVLGLGYWALEHWLHHGGSVSESHETESVPEPIERTEVILTPEKISRVHLAEAICNKQKLHPILSVPGRLEFEPKRRLELKAPTSAVVRQIHVQPGVVVSEGDPLILIDSEEIGLARAELRNQREQESLAEAEFARAREIEKTIGQLREDFNSGISASEIEARYKDHPMGVHRETLFTSYSQYLLAKNLAENIKDMENSGALSTRMILERKSQLEVSEASFRSALEQSLYDSQLRSKQASAALKHARDLTAVSTRKLAVLAGNFSLPAEELEAVGHLTEMTLRSPFSGTVIESYVQEGARVGTQEMIFLLGDTSRLWVSVEVRENQWNALRLRKGETFDLTTPALPGKRFSCTMEFASAGVSAESRSVPLIASLDNSESLFKPGMLVWVEIPSGETPEVLAIPHEAIQTHENRKFVFVPGSDRHFKREDVVVGREDGRLCEITSGLTEGTRVVTDGAFTLKSELLLEAEE